MGDIPIRQLAFVKELWSDKFLGDEHGGTGIIFAYGICDFGRGGIWLQASMVGAS
jgi:hypothetical protein